MYEQVGRALLLAKVCLVLCRVPGFMQGGGTLGVAVGLAATSPPAWLTGKLWWGSLGTIWYSSLELCLLLLIGLLLCLIVLGGRAIRQKEGVPIGCIFSGLGASVELGLDEEAFKKSWPPPWAPARL